MLGVAEGVRLGDGEAVRVSVFVDVLVTTKVSLGVRVMV
jgi:hypothetical protein